MILIFFFALLPKIQCFLRTSTDTLAKQETVDNAAKPTKISREHFLIIICILLAILVLLFFVLFCCVAINAMSTHRSRTYGTTATNVGLSMTSATASVTDLPKMGHPKGTGKKKKYDTKYSATEENTV